MGSYRVFHSEWLTSTSIKFASLFFICRGNARTSLSAASSPLETYYNYAFPAVLVWLRAKQRLIQMMRALHCNISAMFGTPTELKKLGESEHALRLAIHIIDRSRPHADAAWQKSSVISNNRYCRARGHHVDAKSVEGAPLCANRQTCLAARPF